MVFIPGSGSGSDDRVGWCFSVSMDADCQLDGQVYIRIVVMFTVCMLCVHVPAIGFLILILILILHLPIIYLLLRMYLNTLMCVSTFRNPPLSFLFSFLLSSFFLQLLLSIVSLSVRLIRL